MGLFDKIRGEFVDIIEWLDASNDTMVYRFARYQNEIKTPPVLTFYAVINGQQAGPYDMNTLKQLATQNQFTKTILVWCEDMADWTAAGELRELNSVFGSILPPIPRH